MVCLNLSQVFADFLFLHSYVCLCPFTLWSFSVCVKQGNTHCTISFGLFMSFSSVEYW